MLVPGKLLEVSQLLVQDLVPIVAKARRQKTLFDLSVAAHMDALFIDVGSLSPGRHEGQTQQRGVDDAHLDLSTDFQTDGNAEKRKAMDVIGRSIQRINEPKAVARAFCGLKTTFLTEDVKGGKVLPKMF